jgi:hypothetical protein
MRDGSVSARRHGERFLGNAGRRVRREQADRRRRGNLIDVPVESLADHRVAARVAGINAQRSDDGWVGGQQGGQHPALSLRRGEVGLSGLAARGSERGHVDEMGEQLWR